MKKLILNLLTICLGLNLLAFPQDEVVAHQEPESLIPPIEAELVLVEAECISPEEIKYCLDIYLCDIYIPTEDFHVSISPVPGDNWQYAGNATQVGSDDFHFELCFVTNEVLDPGQWVFLGSYSQVNPDDIWPGNGTTYCSGRKLFDMPEPTGDCPGCDADLVVTDGDVDITSTLTTEMLCGDNCVDIHVTNMEWANYNASVIMLTDGEGLFCNPPEGTTYFEVRVEGVDICGNEVSLSIGVNVEQDCDCPFIENVAIWNNPWNNTSGASADNYTDYTGETCIPMIDAAQPQLNVDANIGDVFLGVFIDLNGDGDFDDDEEVRYNAFDANGTTGSSFTSIVDQLQGGELVRVIVSTEPIDPLVVPECGEMEDYIICGGHGDCPHIDETFIWGGEWINQSGASATNYTDFTDETCIPLLTASIPQLNISSSVADVFMGIFIDANGDGDFDDAEEVLFNNFVIGEGVGSNFQDVLPLLDGGELVRFVVSTDPIDPLVVPECGEMEDYVVCGGVDCSDVEANPLYEWEADCLEVTFTDVSTVVGGLFTGETLWDFGYEVGGTQATGSTQAGGTITHTFPAAGDYTVCMTIQVFTSDGDCCHYEYCETITLSEGCGCIPEPTIEVYPGLCPVPCCYVGDFTNNASYAPTTVYWIWGDGNQTIIHNDPYDPDFDGFDAFHTYTTSGNFTVQVFALYHPDGDDGVCCGVFSNEAKASCGGGGDDSRKNMIDESSDKDLNGKVSPNPVSMADNQSFYLDIENSSDSEIRMEMMDMNGRVVYKQFELSGESTNLIQLNADIAPGIYFVRLFNGIENVQNIKLLITE